MRASRVVRSATGSSSGRSMSIWCWRASASVSVAAGTMPETANISPSRPPLRACSRSAAASSSGPTTPASCSSSPMRGRPPLISTCPARAVAGSRGPEPGRRTERRRRRPDPAAVMLACPPLDRCNAHGRVVNARRTALWHSRPLTCRSHPTEELQPPKSAGGCTSTVRARAMKPCDPGRPPTFSTATAPPSGCSPASPRELHLPPLQVPS